MQGKICRLATHTGLVVVLAVSLTSAAAPAVRVAPPADHRAVVVEESQDDPLPPDVTRVVPPVQHRLTKEVEAVVQQDER